MKNFILVCIFIGVAFAASPQDDLIVNLPGLQDPINFKQYAGYKTVDPVNNRQLFYWFVESQDSPSTDPVVLWLNGGPVRTGHIIFFFLIFGVIAASFEILIKSI